MIVEPTNVYGGFPTSTETRRCCQSSFRARRMERSSRLMGLDVGREDEKAAATMGGLGMCGGTDDQAVLGPHSMGQLPSK